MREVAAQFGASIVCTTEHDIIHLPQTGTRASQTSERRFKLVHYSRKMEIVEEEKEEEKKEEEKEEEGEKEDEKKEEEEEEDRPLTTNPTPSPSQMEELPSSCPGHRTDRTYHLFAYPAQSNFSGRKYPLSWAVEIEEGSLSPLPTSSSASSSSNLHRNLWKVVVDAASFVGTNPLNLSHVSPSFVAVSFYKMFGFPTGLGALLVRKDCSTLLCKRYYGGGTVLATISRAGVHIPRLGLHDR